MTLVLSNERQTLAALTVGGILPLVCLLHVDDIVAPIGVRKLFTS